MIPGEIDIKQLAEHLLETEDDAIFIVSCPDHKYIYANKAWLRMADELMGLKGCALEDMLGKAVEDFAEEGLLKERRILQNIYKHKKPVRLDDVCLMPEDKGKTFWCVSFWPIKDRKGRVAHILGKVSPPESNYLKKDEFFAIVAHELRTPITILQLYLNLLKDRRIPADRWDDAIKSAFQQSQHLSRILQDYLEVSRLNQNRGPLHLAPFDLTAKLRDIISTFKDIAPQSIIYTPRCGETMIEGDDNRLEQVFFNIIENAVKYSPPDTTIRICFWTSNGYAYVTVKDEGIGIPEEEQPYIFERFYRARNGSALTGMGIGLYVSMEIIRQHGGAIEVRSKMGEGTAFTVKLPLFDEENGYNKVI
ncbi:MAG: ATP-binding protein [Bacillota bacterium]